jgi:hypothetical protein
MVPDTPAADAVLRDEVRCFLDAELGPALRLAVGALQAARRVAPVLLAFGITVQAAFGAAAGVPERDWTHLLAARIDLHWAHHGAPPQNAPWALAGAVTHTGRSSVVLRLAMFQGTALHAAADCVMVNTDPAGPPGPAPLAPALREALQALAWHGPAVPTA